MGPYAVSVRASTLKRACGRVGESAIFPGSTMRPVGGTGGMASGVARPSVAPAQTEPPTLTQDADPDSANDARWLPQSVTGSSGADRNSGRFCAMVPEALTSRSSAAIGISWRTARLPLMA